MPANLVCLKFATFELAVYIGSHSYEEDEKNCDNFLCPPPTYPFGFWLCETGPYVCPHLVWCTISYGRWPNILTRSYATPMDLLLPILARAVLERLFSYVTRTLSVTLVRLWGLARTTLRNFSRLARFSPTCSSYVLVTRMLTGP